MACKDEKFIWQAFGRLMRVLGISERMIRFVWKMYVPMRQIANPGALHELQNG